MEKKLSYGQRRYREDPEYRERAKANSRRRYELIKTDPEARAEHNKSRRRMYARNAEVRRRACEATMKAYHLKHPDAKYRDTNLILS